MRYGWIVPVVLLAFVFTVPSVGAYARQEPPGGDYFIGYFAWNEGKGRLAWEPVDSEDPGGSQVSGYGDVFVSDPLPRTLHINASRLVELDAYTRGRPSGTSFTSCQSSPSIGLAVNVEGKIFTGIFHGGAGFRNTAIFPPDPPEHGVCRLRTQAEMSVLPRGTVLTVNLTRGLGTPPAYGMADDHRSVLRIPYYSDHEMPYRYPTYAHGGPQIPKVGEGTAGWLLGVASIAVPILGAFSRERRGALLLLAALLVAGFAGCLGDSGKAAADPQSLTKETLVPRYQEGNLSQQGLGSLIGDVVAKSSRQAIGGAYVYLVGTSRFQQTDPYGRFVFSDLKPGTYRVRVDRAGYHPFEGEAAVVADLIARIEVSLEIVGSPPPQANGHPHDYWGGKNEIVLMDRVNIGDGGFQAFWIPPQVGQYRSILPGTYDVNVTVDWDPQENDFSTITLSVLANDEADPGNSTYMLSRGPGVPFHIASGWEMGDPGHQRFSMWAFAVWGRDGLNINGGNAANVLVDNVADRARPPFSGWIVTLTISKGTVPLEPQHPDLWRGQSYVRSLEGYSQPVHRQDVLTPYYEAFDAARRQQVPSDGLTVVIPNEWNNAWLLNRTVPPDTKTIEIWANASRDLVTAYPVELRIKTARSGPPSADCWTYWQEDGVYCEGGDYTEFGAGTVTGRSTHWVLTPEPDEPDPFYAPRSFWVVGLRSARDSSNLAALEADSTAGGPLAYTLTVVSHRGPSDTPMS